MKKYTKIICLALVVSICLFFCSCTTAADTVEHNVQKDADYFGVYRRMTFINLYTDKPLYSAEGYFSLRTTVDNTYQGQQEIALLFKVGPDEYKMDYFSIANNVTYVIEQAENTNTDPYHWEINWYIPIPENHVGREKS